MFPHRSVHKEDSYHHNIVWNNYAFHNFAFVYIWHRIEIPSRTLQIWSSGYIDMSYQPADHKMDMGLCHQLPLTNNDQKFAQKSLTCDSVQSIGVCHMPVVCRKYLHSIWRRQCTKLPLLMFSRKDKWSSNWTQHREDKYQNDKLVHIDVSHKAKVCRIPDHSAKCLLHKA